MQNSLNVVVQLTHLDRVIYMWEANFRIKGAIGGEAEPRRKCGGKRTAEEHRHTGHEEIDDHSSMQLAVITSNIVALSDDSHEGLACLRFIPAAEAGAFDSVPPSEHLGCFLVITPHSHLQLLPAMATFQSLRRNLINLNEHNHPELNVLVGEEKDVMKELNKFAKEKVEAGKYMAVWGKTEHSDIEDITEKFLTLFEEFAKFHYELIGSSVATYFMPTSQAS